MQWITKHAEWCRWILVMVFMAGLHYFDSRYITTEQYRADRRAEQEAESIRWKQHGDAIDAVKATVIALDKSITIQSAFSKTLDDHEVRIRELEKRRMAGIPSKP